jgi:D-glycero-alpha-D-manno-heptose 1-phosphate guanylyltransferase
VIQTLADTTAFVLAGGLGTRLRSVVSDRPKVLALVAGRPYLAHLLDQLADAGVRRAVLCTGYRADQVRATFGIRYRELDLSYSEEDQPLGTAGALRLALPQADSEILLVLNGDSYCAADLSAFWRFHAGHRPQGSSASLVLTEVANTLRFGRVEVNSHGVVTRFLEKGDTAGPGLINAGVYLLDRSLVEPVPTGQPVSLERDLYPNWIGRGLYGCATASEFIDIGTPESYAVADRFFHSLAARAA